MLLTGCNFNKDDDSEKTAGSISYATTSVEKTTDNEAFTNTLTNTGDGTVSYASSKETVATVNATTGEVTIAGAGETTITATVADSENYTYETKTASYTLTVTQATPSYTVSIASGIEHGTVTADKTSAEKGATVTLTLSASDGYEFGMLSVTDASNAEITTTAVTEGSKYTFTMPESNVTVSATFTALPPSTANYTVKHLFQKIDASGYEQNASYPDESKSGTVGTETQAEAKSITGFTAQSFTQATIAASGTVVEIKYDRKSYTVTFDSNGGSDVSSQTVRYEAKATEPSAPTKTATTTTKYTFADWYNGETAFDFATPITDDITLKAKWNETALYTVTLTGGANATISGGNTTQEGLSDAMETVTFTANDGYYFEDFTDITSNGITATRTSDSVVTVSGTPTGNASITIPDATEQQATTYSITLTGPYSNFTLVMEYQEGDTWNDMATKYPDYIKIYNKWPGFHTDGLIYEATGNKVLAIDVIDPNKTYIIQ